MERDVIFINKLNLIFEVFYINYNASIVLYGCGTTSISVLGGGHSVKDSCVTKHTRRNRKLSSVHKHIVHNAI
jgi:hypothetical protein